MFQTYDITSYDVLYDCSHMPLHCPRNKKYTIINDSGRFGLEKSSTHTIVTAEISWMSQDFSYTIFRNSIVLLYMLF